MKRIILLVDIGNCKFLILKNKNFWELPSLVIKNKKINDNSICTRYQEKYNQNIKKIELIEETDEYKFVKCILDDKMSCKYEYKTGVINEIMPIITNKFQKRLLLDLSVKIGMEILNDSFWLGILLSIEDRIDNQMMKALLSDFLLFFSSSFCEEVIKYKFGSIVDPNILSRKKLKELRNSYFKLCPLYDSDHMKIIIEDMGIDFNRFVFDNTLIYANGELLDVNIRMWKNGTKFNLNYNSVIMSARKWVQNFLYQSPNLIETLEKSRETFIDKYIKEFNSIKISNKPYSVYKLFSNELSNNDKIYILQRIGLLKTILLFSKILSNKNIIKENKNNYIELDINVFLIKVKAVIIDMLWTDNKKNSIPFVSKIINNYPKEIKEEFFSINRKCRDNIHYGYCNSLTEKDYDILIKYQDIYLKYIIDKLDSQLKIKFGVGYKIELALAKLQCWASNK